MPEHFGTVCYFHTKENYWRTWHVYADVNHFGEIEFIFVELGNMGMPSNGTSPKECKSGLLKRALEHVEEELVNSDSYFDVIDEGDKYATSGY